MILDLREFKTFPAHKLLKTDPEGLTVDLESVIRVEDAGLNINIQKSGEEYFCQGKVKATLALECSRCLQEFGRELENDVDFIICSEELPDSRKGVIDDEDYVYFEGGDLLADLSNIVRQAIILSVSMKPLCSESCRGLCPQCGANLNKSPCGCKSEQIDERWEGLRGLSEPQ